MSVSLAGRFGSVFDLTGLNKIYWTELNKFTELTLGKELKG
jgi:hypothetical protein